MGVEKQLKPALLAALRGEHHDGPGQHWVGNQLPGVGGRSGNIPKLSAAHDTRYMESGRAVGAERWWGDALAEGDFCAGEDGSRIYTSWHAISTAAVANDPFPDDSDVPDAARRWLRTYFTFLALGASPWRGWKNAEGERWVGYSTTLCGNRSWSSKHGGPVPNDEMWRQADDMLLFHALDDSLPTVTGWEADCVRAMGRGWHWLSDGERHTLQQIVDGAEPGGQVLGWLSEFTPRRSVFRFLRWENGQSCTVCLNPTNRNTDPIYAIISHLDGGLEVLLGSADGDRGAEDFDHVSINADYSFVFAGDAAMELPDVPLVYDVEYGPEGARVLYPNDDVIDPDPSPDDDYLPDEPVRNPGATLQDVQVHLGRMEVELRSDEPNLNIVSNNLGRAQILTEQEIKGL